MKKKIFYWGPFLSDQIATVKAIFNSAVSINKYSKDYQSTVINAVGEWNNFKIDNPNQLTKYYDFGINNFKNLPRFTYLKSRFSYILIFMLCFFPLKNLLRKEKPDYLIAHLIVSLPLVLYIFFRFQTKLCLRISGKPKLNLFRTFLWKLASSKIDKILCPTAETKELLINKKIFDESKIFILHDPIINIRQVSSLKKEKIEDLNFAPGNLLLIGRLTKQKNFQIFINSFKEILIDYPNLKAYIIGEGELKKYLTELIKKNKLVNKVFLLGYKKNIFKYLNKSKIFILTSLWEDPGFVLAESAACNTTILTSDCASGPKEFVSKEQGGYFFQNNDIISLIGSLKKALSDEDENKYKKKIFAKNKSKKYSIFRHYLELEEVLK